MGGYITLQYIYQTKKGMLRAVIRIETKDHTQRHILKITKNTQSLISGNGYVFYVDIIDLGENYIRIVTCNNEKFNIRVGGKVRLSDIMIK